MDYAFLPEKVKSFLKAARPGAALCILRGSGGFSGEPGESYLAAYPDKLFLFGKAFGDREFIARQVDYAMSAPEISLRQDKFSGTLELFLPDGKLKMKLSLLETENCGNLLKQFSMPAGTVVEETPADAAESRPDLLTALAACMKHLAACDGETGIPEQRMINEICRNGQALPARAEEWFKRCSFQEILAKITLDEQQKLCFLANFYELAMCDERLRSAEQRMINEFIRSKEIAPDQAAALREALLIKNQLSVLTAQL